MAIYSHSRINTFENCPLQFKFRYIDRIKSDQEGIEAFLGSRVHEVLEKLFADLQYSKENSLPQLLEYFEQNWRQKWHDKIVIVKPEYSVEHYRKTGERCIRDFYQRYAPFEDGKTLGLEKPVTIKLAEGRYLIKGFIDRLVKVGDNRYEVHDYKTSRQVPPQRYLDSDRQLALYQIAVEEMWPDVKEVELVWHYLACDAEVRSKRTPGQLAALKKKVVQQIEEIEAAENFPPKASSLCPWCVYQYLCPLKKHLFKTEQMTAEEFSSDDGVTMVDKYADLKVKEKELKEQIDKMKEQIRIYAAREETSLIRGSNYKIKMQSRRDCQLINEEELEQTLKDKHLFEDVSKINKKLFENLLDSNGTDQQLKTRLERYREIKFSSSPYLYKLKDFEK